MFSLERLITGLNLLYYSLITINHIYAGIIYRNSATMSQTLFGTSQLLSIQTQVISLYLPSLIGLDLKRKLAILNKLDNHYPISLKLLRNGLCIKGDTIPHVQPSYTWRGRQMQQREIQVQPHYAPCNQLTSGSGDWRSQIQFILHTELGYTI